MYRSKRCTRHTNNKGANVIDKFPLFSDINECKDSKTCEGGRSCVNTVGNYSCVCPKGQKEKDGECIGKFRQS